MSDFPDPDVFYEKYVKASQPLIIKNGAKQNPAFTLWSDKYLREMYGYLEVDVEQGKKESRKREMNKYKLSNFLDEYQTSDIYMVQDIFDVMRGDLTFLKSLQCGGFQSRLEASVIWFSSGGTKSVLHFDSVDNINCMLDGSKEFVLIDRYDI